MPTIAPPKTHFVRLAPPHRFTRDDYHAMAGAGILGEDDRVELIAGEIIAQMPIGTTHASVAKRFNEIFARLVQGRLLVSAQDPIALDAFSEPQPDLALLRPRSDYYADSHPTPEDVILLIEVADTSLAFDREEKIPLYAGAGIPEVWLVDLVDKSLSVYRQPAPGGYPEVSRHRAGAIVSVPSLANITLGVSELGL